MINTEKLEELFNIPVSDIRARLNLKRVWFEHVKRRPDIDYVMEPLRAEVFNQWKNQLPGNDERRHRIPQFLLKPVYSTEEQKIIDTPIEKLMEDYEKFLKI